MAELFIGCSGFSYRHWRGTFYPEDLPQKEWFTYYRSVFSTVELNVSFYRTPKPETYRHWYEETSPDFSFAVKGSRFITHIKRLQEPEVHLERFFTPALELAEKLKVVLWQFSPAFKCDIPRLEASLAELKHYKVRSTIEFRNESWIIPEVTELLKAHGISYCQADAPPFLYEPPVSADFVYIR